jgi:cephalosporin hydroxylase
MLSVLIPSRNEQYLEKTILDVLSNATGDIEILAVLDGYIPEPQIVINDSRVKFIYNETSIGQRASINQAARQAQGKYILKLDAHCMVAPGFDTTLAKDCEYDWTVVPTMYVLDINNWTPKLHKKTNYMYISSPTADPPFRAKYFEGRRVDNRQREPRNDKMIDDTMACMGPCWFMHKERFFEQGGCDEEHGSWGAQSIEVSLKAWLSGGSLKVNKNTWFAHWFRNGGLTFPYPNPGSAQEKARQYSRDLWLNDKWPLAKRKLQWVVDKFSPPGWELQEKKMTFDKYSYYHATINNKRRPVDERFVKWFGTSIVKYPSDILNYQEIIFKTKPDFIVETGTKWGGSAIFFAHVCELMGHGQVISVDINNLNPPQHPRITYIIGRATSVETLAKVKELVGTGTVMVTLDSDHTRRHVKRELLHYGRLVTKGNFLVVEDTNYPEIGGKDGPDEAVKWYLATHKEFAIDTIEDKWIYSCNVGGWLRKI